MNTAEQIEIDYHVDINRDSSGVAHVVGVSGGKDSTCLALALKEKQPDTPFTYIYTPTGNELPEMIMHMKRLEKLLGQEILGLSNGTLRSIIYEQKMIPNYRSRFCTRILKLVPAGRFYEKYSPVIAYIGLRKDEDEREGTRPGGDSASIESDVKQVFPFQQWGWGLGEVWAFLNDRGITIPERTDCAWCPYQRLGEWYNLWKDHPDIYREGEEIEEEFGHTFRSDGRDTWPASMKDLRLKFEAGEIPERSLRMMDKRQGMCRVCSM